MYAGKWFQVFVLSCLTSLAHTGLGNTQFRGINPLQLEPEVDETAAEIILGSQSAIRKYLLTLLPNLLENLDQKDDHYSTLYKIIHGLLTRRLDPLKPFLENKSLLDNNLSLVSKVAHIISNLIGKIEVTLPVKWKDFLQSNPHFSKVIPPKEMLRVAYPFFETISSSQKHYITDVLLAVQAKQINLTTPLLRNILYNFQFQNYFPDVQIIVDNLRNALLVSKHIDFSNFHPNGKKQVNEILSDILRFVLKELNMGPSMTYQVAQLLSMLTNNGNIRKINVGYDVAEWFDIINDDDYPPDVIHAKNELVKAIRENRFQMDWSKMKADLKGYSPLEKLLGLITRLTNIPNSSPQAARIHALYAHIKLRFLSNNERYFYPHSVTDIAFLLDSFLTIDNPVNPSMIKEIYKNFQLPGFNWEVVLKDFDYSKYSKPRPMVLDMLQELIRNARKLPPCDLLMFDYFIQNNSVIPGCRETSFQNIVGDKLIGPSTPISVVVNLPESTERKQCEDGQDPVKLVDPESIIEIINPTLNSGFAKSLIKYLPIDATKYEFSTRETILKSILKNLRDNVYNDSSDTSAIDQIILGLSFNEGADLPPRFMYLCSNEITEIVSKAPKNSFKETESVQNLRGGSTPRLNIITPGKVQAIPNTQSMTTSVPDSHISSTQSMTTSVPDSHTLSTQSTPTSVPDSHISSTQFISTPIPDSQSSNTQSTPTFVPDSQSLYTQSMTTQVPDSHISSTQSISTLVPDSQSSNTQSRPTFVPDSHISSTPVPDSQSLYTQSMTTPVLNSHTSNMQNSTPTENVTPAVPGVAEVLIVPSEPTITVLSDSSLPCDKPVYIIDQNSLTSITHLDPNHNQIKFLLSQPILYEKYKYFSTREQILRAVLEEKKRDKNDPVQRHDLAQIILKLKITPEGLLRPIVTLGCPEQGEKSLSLPCPTERIVKIINSEDIVSIMEPVEQAQIVKDILLRPIFYMMYGHLKTRKEVYQAVIEDRSKEHFFNLKQIVQTIPLNGKAELPPSVFESCLNSNAVYAGSAPSECKENEEIKTVVDPYSLLEIIENKNITPIEDVLFKVPILAEKYVMLGNRVNILLHFLRQFYVECLVNNTGEFQNAMSNLHINLKGNLLPVVREVCVAWVKPYLQTAPIGSPNPEIQLSSTSLIQNSNVPSSNLTRPPEFSTVPSTSSLLQTCLPYETFAMIYDIESVLDSLNNLTPSMPHIYDKIKAYLIPYDGHTKYTKSQILDVILSNMLSETKNEKTINDINNFKNFIDRDKGRETPVIVGACLPPDALDDQTVFMGQCMSNEILVTVVNKNTLMTALGPNAPFDPYVKAKIESYIIPIEIPTIYTKADVLRVILNNVQSEERDVRIHEIVERIKGNILEDGEGLQKPDVVKICLPKTLMEDEKQKTTNGPSGPTFPSQPLTTQQNIPNKLRSVTTQRSNSIPLQSATTQRNILNLLHSISTQQNEQNPLQSITTPRNILNLLQSITTQRNKPNPLQSISTQRSFSIPLQSITTQRNIPNPSQSMTVQKNKPDPLRLVDTKQDITVPNLKQPSTLVIGPLSAQTPSFPVYSSLTPQSPFPKQTSAQALLPPSKLKSHPSDNSPCLYTMGATPPAAAPLSPGQESSDLSPINLPATVRPEVRIPMNKPDMPFFSQSSLQPPKSQEFPRPIGGPSSPESTIFQKSQDYELENEFSKQPHLTNVIPEPTKRNVVIEDPSTGSAFLLTHSTTTSSPLAYMTMMNDLERKKIDEMMKWPIIIKPKLNETCFDKQNQNYTVPIQIINVTSLFEVLSTDVSQLDQYLTTTYLTSLDSYYKLYYFGIDTYRYKNTFLHDVLTYLLKFKNVETDKHLKRLMEGISFLNNAPLLVNVICNQFIYDELPKPTDGAKKPISEVFFKYVTKIPCYGKGFVTYKIGTSLKNDLPAQVLTTITSFLSYSNDNKIFEEVQWDIIETQRDLVNLLLSTLEKQKVLSDGQRQAVDYLYQHLKCDTLRFVKPIVLKHCLIPDTHPKHFMRFTTTDVCVGDSSLASSNITYYLDIYSLLKTLTRIEPNWVETLVPLLSDPKTLHKLSIEHPFIANTKAELLQEILKRLVEVKEDRLPVSTIYEISKAINMYGYGSTPVDTYNDCPKMSTSPKIDRFIEKTVLKPCTTTKVPPNVMSRFLHIPSLLAAFQPSTPRKFLTAFHYILKQPNLYTILPNVVNKNFTLQDYLLIVLNTLKERSTPVMGQFFHELTKHLNTDRKDILFEGEECKSPLNTNGDFVKFPSGNGHCMFKNFDVDVSKLLESFYSNISQNQLTALGTLVLTKNKDFYDILKRVNVDEYQTFGEFIRGLIQTSKMYVGTPVQALLSTLPKYIKQNTLPMEILIECDIGPVNLSSVIDDDKMNALLDNPGEISLRMSDIASKDVSDEQLKKIDDALLGQRQLKENLYKIFGYQPEHAKNLEILQRSKLYTNVMYNGYEIIKSLPVKEKTELLLRRYFESSFDEEARNVVGDLLLSFEGKGRRKREASNVNLLDVLKAAQLPQDIISSLKNITPYLKNITISNDFNDFLPYLERVDIGTKVPILLKLTYISLPKNEIALNIKDLHNSQASDEDNIIDIKRHYNEIIQYLRTIESPTIDKEKKMVLKALEKEAYEDRFIKKIQQMQLSPRENAIVSLRRFREIQNKKRREGNSDMWSSITKVLKHLKDENVVIKTDDLDIVGCFGAISGPENILKAKAAVLKYVLDNLPTLLVVTEHLEELENFAEEEKILAIIKGVLEKQKPEITESFNLLANHISYLGYSMNDAHKLSYLQNLLRIIENNVETTMAKEYVLRAVMEKPEIFEDVIRGLLVENYETSTQQLTGILSHLHQKKHLFKEKNLPWAIDLLLKSISRVSDSFLNKHNGELVPRIVELIEKAFPTKRSPHVMETFRKIVTIINNHKPELQEALKHVRLYVSPIEILNRLIVLTLKGIKLSEEDNTTVEELWRYMNTTEGEVLDEVINESKNVSEILNSLTENAPKNIIKEKEVIEEYLKKYGVRVLKGIRHNMMDMDVLVTVLDNISKKLNAFDYDVITAANILLSFLEVPVKLKIPEEPYRSQKIVSDLWLTFEDIRGRDLNALLDMTTYMKNYPATVEKILATLASDETKNLVEIFLKAVTLYEKPISSRPKKAASILLELMRTDEKILQKNNRRGTATSGENLDIQDADVGKFEALKEASVRFLFSDS